MTFRILPSCLNTQRTASFIHGGFYLTVLRSIQLNILRMLSHCNLKTNFETPIAFQSRRFFLSKSKCLALELNTANPSKQSNRGFLSIHNVCRLKRDEIVDDKSPELSSAKDCLSRSASTQCCTYV